MACFYSEGSVSSVVRHVQVPIVDNAVCNKLYAKLAHIVELEIPEDMMCAGFDDGGHDACQVDHCTKRFAHTPHPLVAFL